MPSDERKDNLKSKNADGMDIDRTAILECIDEGCLIITEDRLCVFINDPACEILKCRRSQILGKKIGEIDLPFEGFHLSDIMDSVEKTSTSREMHAAIRAGTGRRILLAIKILPLPKGLGILIKKGYQPVEQGIPSKTPAENEIDAHGHTADYRTEAKISVILNDICPDAIIILSEGRCVYINKAGLDSLKTKDPGAVIGRRFDGFVHPDDRPRFKARIRSALTRNTSIDFWELKLLRFDGKTAYVIIAAAPILFKRRLCLQLFIRDITDQVKAERALIESEARYKAISELISHFSYAVDVTADGTFINRWFSDHISGILGYSAREIKEMGDCVRLIHPDDTPVVKRRMERLFAGESDTSEFRLVKKDGEILWIRDYAQPILDDEKKRVVHIYGAAQDITERKEVEVALKLKEDAISASMSGIIIGDLDGVIIYVNRACLEFLRYTDENELLNRSAIELVSNKDDAYRMIDELLADGRSAKEFHGVRNDGSGFTAYVSANLISDQKGRPQYIMASFLDITERKKTERALIESESKFRMLFDTSPDGIVISTLDGRFLDANKSFLEMTGYSIDHLRELRSADILPQEYKKREEEEYARIKNGEMDRGRFEKEIIRSDNTVIPVSITGWVTRDRNGIPLKRYGFIKDISEIKKAEKALNETHAKLQQERKHLIEKNIALKEIMAHIEEEKLGIRKEVAREIERILLPALNKMVRNDGTVCNKHLELLKTGLKNLAGASGGLGHFYTRLTTREVEICNLIKSGASSKEIAHSLNISIQTVNKHRITIRRKLGITDKNTNLITYLNSI